MKKNSGFTLIELLVVIAIIGILASVVLASLSSARSKGNDAAVQTNLKNAISQAELYSHYKTPVLTYSGVCTTDITNAKSISGMVLAAAKASISGATVDTTGALGLYNKSVCHDAAGGWAAQVPLSASTSTSPSWWCVDSTGFSRKTSNALGASNDIICN